MRDNLIIVGTNSPKEHQAVITRLIHGLAELYLKDKTHLFPYPETMIDESQTSPAPDIILYDHRQEKTIVIIEITHSVGVKKDSVKVQALMSDYDVQEGFVYDYKKDHWFKFERNDQGFDTKESSLCNSLNLELASFLKKK